MTNAEKLLKVDAEEFIDKYTEWYFSIERELEKGSKDVYEFLRAECKPTLTEDERVILRNLDSYTEIGRTEKDVAGCTDVYIKGKNTCESLFIFKSNLFQFIKERRRI